LFIDPTFYRSHFLYFSWYHETPHPESLPDALAHVRPGGREKVGYHKTTSKKFSKKELEKCSDKICTGPKGGKYIIKGGVKIYLK
jgi:hypothetical protein